MAARWRLVFINGEGEDIDLDGDDATINVFGRLGDWGTLPFDIMTDPSLSGDEAVITGVQWKPGQLTVPLGFIHGVTPQWTRTDEYARIMRPMLDDETPNRGYFYFERLLYGTPDRWRIPVAPLPFQGWSDAGAVGLLPNFRTELRFQTLSAYWEEDPASAVNKVIKAQADASWSTYTWTETPGGDAPAVPTWTINGPSSGTLNTVTLTHGPTGRILRFDNLGMTSGQQLVITTGFMQKAAMIGGSNLYGRRSQDSQFWHLRPSAQSITITKNASSQSGVFLSYRKRRQGL